MSMERAYRRLAKAIDEYAEAHRNLAEDRNRKAGAVYEMQKELNESVRLHMEAEYEASWIDRWRA